MKKINDIYFPQWGKVLRQREIPYTYAPKFFGTLSLTTLYRAFKILKKSQEPVLTEFQVLTLKDYLCLLLFIAAYPFKVFHLIRGLGEEYKDRLLRSALWGALDNTVVRGRLRLLYGRRLSLLKVDKIKCISWYENQAIDKCFYRGLRAVSGKVKVYGAQFCIWPETLLNFYVDEGEAEFGIVPDKILVNGAYYLPDESSERFSVGPSMRYEKLFRVKNDLLASEKVLVIMPYWEHDINYLLDIITGLPTTTPLCIKFHPSTDRSKYQKRIRENIEVAEGDLYDLLNDTKLAMGMSSGSLVEAASLGIPVICVDNPSEFSHNYLHLIDIGKGVLWARANSGSETRELIDKFSECLKKDASQLKKAGEEFGKMFFCKPTEAAIVKAFDLKDL